MEDHALIVVARCNDAARDGEPGLKSLAAVDNRFPKRIVSVPSSRHTRLILAPCGDLLGDTDDVRRVGEAAAAGTLEALGMGASRLSLELQEAVSSTIHPADGKVYHLAQMVSELAAWQAAHVPLMAREAGPAAKRRRLSSLTLTSTPSCGPWQAGSAQAIEEGRELARDIGSADPERMTPMKLADLVAAHCRPAGIAVEILDDVNLIRRDYPLLHAVARASLPVERHHPRVVRLAWQGSGAAERTVLIAGKGVTYDTGGADIKTGGGMAGMRRDKCGAAAAAGFVVACARAPAELTRGLRVVVELGCVRNSIGSDAYVADEVITGHAGKRVLVGNTDMEGRMVLADCLSHLRARAIKEALPGPTFLSLATLTGHAKLSYGSYAVALDSAAARAAGGVGSKLAAAGGLLGQPIEVGSVRREDYDFIAPGAVGTPVSKCPDAYDVLQANTAPSVVTRRGHQFPAAFLSIASGLQEHGPGSKTPMPYCHIDLADSVVDARGVETGSPIVPLFGAFVLGLPH